MSWTETMRKVPPSSSSVASIYDAQAFTVGKSPLVHLPYRYSDGATVIGACGVVGFAVEHDGFRLAEWADSFITCPKCKEKKSRLYSSE